MDEDSPIPSSVAQSVVWPCAAQFYEKSRIIENGAFHSVWIAQCKPTQREVCIKTVDLDKTTSSFAELLQEVQAMRLCDDPNLLHCHCSFVFADELWVVTRLMNKGSCARVLRIAKQLSLSEGFDEDCTAYVLSETVKGLNYLHQRGFIHSEVRASNILLDDSGAVCLSDFGVNRWTSSVPSSSSATSSFSRHATSTDSIAHCAPEVLTDDHSAVDNRVDIWSLGMFALELTKGQSPFAGESVVKATELIVGGEPPSLRSYEQDKREGPVFSKFFEDFCKRCLQKNSKLRPSTAELLKHKLLRSRTSVALVQFLQKIHDVHSDTAKEDTRDNQTPISADNASNKNGSVMNTVSSEADIVLVRMDSTASQRSCERVVADGAAGSGSSWVFDVDEEEKLDIQSQLWSLETEQAVHRDLSV